MHHDILDPDRTRPGQRSTTCAQHALMKPTSSDPGLRPRRLRWLGAATLFCAITLISRAQVVLDFEGVPSTYNYDGPGFNLGGYYGGEPGGPIFGPQATTLEVGGSVNDLLFPPGSGVGMLWGEGLDIELAFAGVPAQQVSLYYRATADVSLFAYDAASALLGSVNGPASLGSDPEGLLAFDAGSGAIAYLRIAGPPGAFVIDDVTYEPVPEPGQIALVAGLGLLAFACWGRRRGGRSA